MKYYYVNNPELGEIQGEFLDLEHLIVTMNNSFLPDGRYKVERKSSKIGKKEFVMYYDIMHEIANESE